MTREFIDTLQSLMHEHGSAFFVHAYVGNDIYSVTLLDHDDEPIWAGLIDDDGRIQSFHVFTERFA